MKDNKENLILDEDYEYEKSLAEEVRARQQALEEARRRAEEEQTAYEKEQQKKRDKRLAAARGETVE